MTIDSYARHPKSIQPFRPRKDPYEWLEDVTGEKAIDWVKAGTKKRSSAGRRTLHFKNSKRISLEILDSNARIPFVSKQGDFYYNFWRDKKNVRGCGAERRWKNTKSQIPNGKPSWT